MRGNTREYPGATSNQQNYTKHTARYTEDSDDEEAPYTGADAPKLNESCLSKWLNCIKGSSTYRNMKQGLSPEGVNSVSRIDQASRCLFPLAFSCFHVFYWMSYLNASDVVGMFF